MMIALECACIMRNHTVRTSDTNFSTLCTKHQGHLHSVGNFSVAFIDGITGSALKKHYVNKHQKNQLVATARFKPTFY